MWANVGTQKNHLNELCVSRLRMIVYKGIGKYSSSQTPAMNFDRSAVSLGLHMEKFSLIMLKKLTGCRPSGCGHFWPHGHTVNELGRGPLVDA